MVGPAFRTIKVVGDMVVPAFGAIKVSHTRDGSSCIWSNPSKL